VMSGAPRANSRGAPSKPTTSSLHRVGRRPGDGERVRGRRSVETCRDVVRRHRDDVVACRRDVARSVVGLARTGEPAGVVERRIRETPELGAEHDLHVVTIRSRHISADVGIRLVDVHLLRLRDVLDGRGGWLGRLLRGRLARRRGHNDDRVLAMNLCLGLDVGLVDELAIEAHRRTALRLHEHPQRHLLSETCGAGCPGARVVRARSPDLSDQVDSNHQASETAHHDDPAVGDDVVLRPLETNEVPAQHLAAVALEHVAGVPEPEQSAVGVVARVPVARHIRAGADPSAAAVRLGPADRLLRQTVGLDERQEHDVLVGDVACRDCGVRTAPDHCDRGRQVRGRLRCVAGERGARRNEARPDHQDGGEGLDEFGHVYHLLGGRGLAIVSWPESHDHACVLQHTNNILIAYMM
jgi:hypothetical protein